MKYQVLFSLKNNEKVFYERRLLQSRLSNVTKIIYKRLQRPGEFEDQGLRSVPFGESFRLSFRFFL